MHLGSLAYIGNAAVFDLGKYLNSDSVVISGFPVEDHTLEVNWEGRHRVENSIIMEVTWVDDAQRLVKEVNRNADLGSVVFFDLNSSDNNKARSHGTVVRKLGTKGEEGDDGWIDNVSFHLDLTTNGPVTDAGIYRIKTSSHSPRA